MNLGQIIERVDLLIDNDGISTEQKVTTINEVAKTLLRTIKLPDKKFEFTTTDEGVYNIPDDVDERKIRYVMIGNARYYPVMPYETNVPYRYCYVVAGKLYLHPNVQNQQAVLYYQPKYIAVTDMEDEPNFPEDYHEILVYGLAKWIAGIQRDIDMVNNFQREFDDLVRQMEIEHTKYAVGEIRPNW